jgi:hypothetical protein
MQTYREIEAMSLDDLIAWHDRDVRNVTPGVKLIQDLIHDRIQRDAMRATNRLAKINSLVALLALGVSVATLLQNSC